MFDDTGRKIDEGWRRRGGFEGYADRVASVVASDEYARPLRDAWRRVRLGTSLAAKGSK